MILYLNASESKGNDLLSKYECILLVFKSINILYTTRTTVILTAQIWQVCMKPSERKLSDTVYKNTYPYSLHSKNVMVGFLYQHSNTWLNLGIFWRKKIQSAFKDFKLQNSQCIFSNFQIKNLHFISFLNSLNFILCPLHPVIPSCLQCKEPSAGRKSWIAPPDWDLNHSLISPG